MPGKGGSLPRTTKDLAAVQMKRSGGGGNASGQLSTEAIQRAKNLNPRYQQRLGFDPSVFGNARVGGASFAQIVAGVQRRHGLVVDGILGPNTWSKLKPEIQRRDESKAGGGANQLEPGVLGPQDELEPGVLGPQDELESGVLGPEDELESGVLGPEDELEPGVLGPEDELESGVLGAEDVAAARANRGNRSRTDRIADRTLNRALDDTRAQDPMITGGRATINEEEYEAANTLESGVIDTSGDPIFASNVQRKADGASADSEEDVGAIAQEGVSGGGQPLPHVDKIQKSFGRHDVTGVRAHVGGPAAEASDAIGAEAYATGNDVAFRGQPGLHTAAHEAAHVVQQRQGVQLEGGVGQSGDVYERQADEAADAVVRGESAAEILGTGARGLGNSEVQRRALQKDEASVAAAGGAKQKEEARPSHDDLKEDLQEFEFQWLEHMREGINDFVHHELEARINEIGSGDWGSFLFSVVGGLIGAAGAFASGGTAFAIGVVSVGVSSFGGIPKPASKDKSVSTAADYMKEHVEALWSERNGKCDAVATQLLNTWGYLRGAGRDQLVLEYLKHNFKPEFYKDASGEPQLEPTKIRRAARDGAIDLFNRWQKQVQPIGQKDSGGYGTEGGSSSWSSEGKLAHIMVSGVPQGRLALVEEVESMTTSTLYTRIRTKYRFKQWISDDLAKAATHRSYGTGQELLALKPDDVQDMPTT